MNDKSNPHHLLLGRLNDFLTGRLIDDTYDERYRQKIAKFLVLKKGFEKKNILSNMELVVSAGEKKAALTIDFLIKHKGKAVILIKYAPGSIVTRRLSTISLSRVVKPYQIPFAVITNGEDAETTNGQNGQLMGEGLHSIPDQKMIETYLENHTLTDIDQKRYDQASRIIYAFEIDGACPCDTDVCVIED
jgi:hypothetical protein